MSTSIDPLKTTTQDLHRFWFSINSTEQWYNIIRECKSWFGKEWKGQGKVKRKLSRHGYNYSRQTPVDVWFDVPDIRFATWISVKYSIIVYSDNKKSTGK